MSEHDERLERKLATEARIRERAAWPPGPLHARAAAIFDAWAKQAALANPQSDTWSSWAFVQDRKKAALKEADRQLLAEAVALAATGSPGLVVPKSRHPAKRGARSQYPWGKMEAETYRLMDHHSDFSADDPEWNAQARLEERLFEFCAATVGREPSPTQLRKHLHPWLREWRAGQSK